MEAAAWGLLGTLAGALASIATAWMTARNSNRIQSEKHAEERAERANEFQRETLLALQEAIHDALRLNTRAHLEDVEAFRRSGSWGRDRLSTEVNEGLLLSRRKVSILVERIVDASLRTDVKALMRLAAEGGFARSEEESEANLFELSNRIAPLLEKIGSVLRSHY